ncbi:hypothetical protein EOT00_06520 [Listeria seeligeri]|uniref:hypothetical protein n=1 Tax=Listeria seeligeri TaxID=1640 RepID=UPI0011199002|nr:hypothetical protein [Listeria seeligeri]QDA74611.1 hypothetical protein EOT00_06520 [Listeria seeligeri]
MTNEIKKANYRIRQEAEDKPVIIQLWCPYCYEENRFNFGELAQEYGTNPRWLKYKKIACQQCEKVMELGDF